MKSIINLCLSTLVAMLAMFATLAGVNSCTEGGLGAYIKGPAVHEECVSAVDAYKNPLMVSIKEVVDLQEQIASDNFVDSVFVSLPEDVLVNVASVALKTKESVTKQDIVEEFLSGKRIYTSLPSENEITKDAAPDILSIELKKEESTEVTDAGNNTVIKTSKDTTIDGKRATVETRITKHE